MTLRLGALVCFLCACTVFLRHRVFLLATEQVDGGAFGTHNADASFSAGFPAGPRWESFREYVRRVRTAVFWSPVDTFPVSTPASRPEYYYYERGPEVGSSAVVDDNSTIINFASQAPPLAATAERRPRRKFALCLVGGVSKLTKQTAKVGDGMAEQLSSLRPFVPIGSAYRSFKRHLFGVRYWPPARNASVRIGADDVYADITNRNDSADTIGTGHGGGGFSSEHENEWDVFIHSWAHTLRSNLTKLWRPRAAIFESNKNYSQEFAERTNKTVGSGRSKQSDVLFGQISWSFSVQTCLRLALGLDVSSRGLSNEKKASAKQESPLDSSDSYSRIVISRPDMLLLSDVPLDLTWPPVGPQEGMWREPFWQDTFIVLSPRVAREWLDVYAGHRAGRAHAWIKHFHAAYMPGINRVLYAHESANRTTTIPSRENILTNQEKLRRSVRPRDLRYLGWVDPWQVIDPESNAAADSDPVDMPFVLHGFHLVNLRRMVTESPRCHPRLAQYDLGPESAGARAIARWQKPLGRECVYQPDNHHCCSTGACIPYFMNASLYNSTECRKAHSERKCAGAARREKVCSLLPWGYCKPCTAYPDLRPWRPKTVNNLLERRTPEFHRHHYIFAGPPQEPPPKTRPPEALDARFQTLTASQFQNFLQEANTTRLSKATLLQKVPFVRDFAGVVWQHGAYCFNSYSAQVAAHGIRTRQCTLFRGGNDSVYGSFLDDLSPSSRSKTRRSKKSRVKQVWPPVAEEYFEYASIFATVKEHIEYRKNLPFGIVEIGGGYGHWGLTGLVLYRRALLEAERMDAGQNQRTQSLDLLRSNNNTRKGTEMFATFVEPVRQHAKFILEHAALNNLSGAVSPSSVVEAFMVGGSDAKKDSLTITPSQQNHKTQAVPQKLTLETLLERHDFVAAMHVDCQTCEFTIFEGYFHTLAAKVARIFIGTHEMYNRARGPVQRLQLVHNFEKAGFRLVWNYPGTTQSPLRAIRDMRFGRSVATNTTHGPVVFGDGVLSFVNPKFKTLDIKTYN